MSKVSEKVGKGWDQSQLSLFKEGRRMTGWGRMEEHFVKVLVWLQIYVEVDRV